MLKATYAVALLTFGALSTACEDNNNDWTKDAPRITFENVCQVKDFVQSGTFEATAVGATTSFSFYAAPGQTLMLASMYDYSNDLFFAPENPGIPLFDAEGIPLTGVLVGAVKLWDNGTRLNEAPGADITHPGMAQSGVVTQIVGEDAEGNIYLPASDIMELSLSFDAVESKFTCTITNISDGTINQTPFSAGVYAVSNILEGRLVNPTPLFSAGESSSAALTALAEEGNVTALESELAANTGIITTLDGAIVVIYTGESNPLYKLGELASNGLREFAEEGDAKLLESELRKMANVKRVYFSESVVQPGKSIQTPYWAVEGDNIAFATKFGYANDWFYASSGVISALYSGSATSQILLLDAGTAANQYPGAGWTQELFDGDDILERQPITPVGSEFPVPSVESVINVKLN